MKKNDEKQMDINGTFVHDWRHYLTPEEKALLRENSVELRNNIDELERDKKLKVKMMTAQIDEVKSEEKEIRETLYKGFEDKTERVKMEEDFENGVINYYHHETGERVHQEEMSDRQKRAFNIGKSAAAS